jgi:hypothetical protein
MIRACLPEATYPLAHIFMQFVLSKQAKKIVVVPQISGLFNLPSLKEGLVRVEDSSGRVTYTDSACFRHRWPWTHATAAATGRATTTTRRWPSFAFAREALCQLEPPHSISCLLPALVPSRGLPDVEDRRGGHCRIIAKPNTIEFSPPV